MITPVAGGGPITARSAPVSDASNGPGRNRHAVPRSFRPVVALRINVAAATADGPGRILTTPAAVVLRGEAAAGRRGRVPPRIALTLLDAVSDQLITRYGETEDVAFVVAEVR